MKAIVCFAQEWMPGEEAAARVFEQLKERLCGVKFLHCFSPFEVLSVKADELYILDSVKGIEHPVLIEDMGLLRSRRVLSAHDCDISLLLKLLAELGKAKIRIIGIPHGSEDIGRMVEEVLGMLELEL